MKNIIISTLVFLGLTPTLFGQVAEWVTTNPGIGGATCMDQFNNSFTAGQYIGPAVFGPYSFPGYGVQDIVVQKYEYVCLFIFQLTMSATIYRKGLRKLKTVTRPIYSVKPTYFPNQLIICNVFIGFE